VFTYLDGPNVEVTRVASSGEMLGNGVLASLARLVARGGPELSASSPTGAAVAGGLAYLAVRLCRDASCDDTSDGRDTPV